MAIDIETTQLTKLNVTEELSVGGVPVTPGGFTPAAAVTDCVPAADGTSAGTQLNALLASLRAAGILAEA